MQNTATKTTHETSLQTLHTDRESVGGARRAPAAIQRAAPQASTPGITHEGDGAGRVRKGRARAWIGPATNSLGQRLHGIATSPLGGDDTLGLVVVVAAAGTPRTGHAQTNSRARSNDVVIAHNAVDGPDLVEGPAAKATEDREPIVCTCEKVVFL